MKFKPIPGQKKQKYKMYEITISVNAVESDTEAPYLGHEFVVDDVGAPKDYLSSKGYCSANSGLEAIQGMVLSMLSSKWIFPKDNDGGNNESNK